MNSVEITARFHLTLLKGGEAMRSMKKIDWWIIGPYAVLSIIGLLEVFSASSYRLMIAGENPRSLLYRQLFFVILSWERWLWFIQ